MKIVILFKRYIAFVIMATIIIQILTFINTYAADIPDGQYAQQVLIQQNTGGSVFFPMGESALLSSYSPTLSTAFITNEFWLEQGPDLNRWVECGVMKGCLNDYYYSGRFSAVCTNPYTTTGYKEYKLGNTV